MSFFSLGFKAPFDVPETEMGAGSLSIIILCAIIIPFFLLCAVAACYFKDKWSLNIPKAERPTVHDVEAPLTKNNGATNLENGK